MDRLDLFSRSNGSLDRILNVGRSLFRKAILIVLAEGLKGMKQTFIALLNQVQDVNIMFPVSFSNRHH